MKMDCTIKNLKLLSAAVCKQAAKDYEIGRNMMNRGRFGFATYLKGQMLVNDVRLFFHSEWFSLLSDLDGPSLYKKIEENYNKYGKSMPFISEKYRDE